jgi:alanyl-tRNA synthetase
VTEKPKFWSGNDIRETFLRFFESKGHRRVRSSSLVPHGDPTLLFTNAGMNQFKDVFLGLEKRDYDKATTAQKCVRAGGKHNDLENVGFTKRHHTFFEMMGNFSFGDYFKEKAIPYAWELITSPDWYGIPKEKLYVTVFGGAEIGGAGTRSGTGTPAGAGPAAATTSPTITLGVDEEARNIWLKANVPAERIVPIPGLKDNFWAMGDTGPCGPCSEIFYDMGVAASEEGHTDCKFPCDCGRYVEIWNLVFMQFNRDASGTLTPLPKPSIDTGMGLERVAATLLNLVDPTKNSNYDTDLFLPLIERAAEIIAGRPSPQGLDVVQVALPSGEIAQLDVHNPSLRVIADHTRASTFLITDGILPSNEGRGYVLRKIMRRGIYHGRLVGRNQPFMHQVAEVVQDEMGLAYPELLENAEQVRRAILLEEEKFARTISAALPKLEAEFLSAAAVAQVIHVARGHFDKLSEREESDIEPDQFPEFENRLKRLESGTFDRLDLNVVLALTKEALPRAKWPLFPGQAAFRLYDTYGLPRDFIEDVCRDNGFGVDWSGFDQAMQEQRTKARASWKGGAKDAANPAFAKIAETFKTEKDFYCATKAKDARIEAIFRGTGTPAGAGSGALRYEMATELKPGEVGEVVLDRTAIYAESGGQVADTGAFYDNSESQLLAEVTGAYYPVAGLVAHKVNAKETLRVGDRVTVVADATRRAHIMRNHTGTHLVHAALRNILGTHVKQAGSLNAPDRLRFDFSHFAHVDAEELRDIEQQVNDEIRHNTEVGTEITSLDHALASGALAFFGDKYPESNVRVVTIPDERAPRGFYSKELCGGTHVHRIGDLGVLKIISEESVAAGVRRIEAVTGTGALDHFQHQAQLLRQLASQLNVGEDAILAQVEKLSNTAKQLEKELDAQKRKGALSQIDELAAKAQVIKGVKVISAQVQSVDREGLRQLVDTLRQKLGSGIVALGMPDNGKVALIAGVTKDLTAKVHAGKLLQELVKQVGGKGGGRPDLAEGGGPDTAALNSALQSVPALVEPLL